VVRGYRTAGEERPTGWAGRRIGALLRDPHRRAALAALLGGQVAMVLIMTMTPLHIHAGGGDLVFVGLVISAHTLGMFALAPLSARLVSRQGATPVALAGMVVLAVAAVLSAVAPADGPLLAVALFRWLRVEPELRGRQRDAGRGRPQQQTQRQGASDFRCFSRGRRSITSGVARGRRIRGDVAPRQGVPRHPAIILRERACWSRPGLRGLDK
jgi:hypothetical protein